MTKYLAFILCLTVATGSRTFGQDTMAYRRSTFAVEIGTGFATSGDAAGVPFRIGARLISGRIGATYCFNGFMGEVGRKGDWDFFGPPQERYSASSLMLSFVLREAKPLRFTGSTGYGRIKYKELDATRTGLDEFGPFGGWAWEMAMGTVGSTAGVSVALGGLINDKRSFHSLTVALTLGHQK
ncbi:MAG: hypothetical protein ACKOYC_10755 [Bacteroidota bacterium]